LNPDELQRLDRLARGIALLVLRRTFGRGQRGTQARSLIVLRVRKGRNAGEHAERDYR
jgi:hypothetical protein